MHEEYMRAALEQAKLAALMDEVPVGAVVVKDGEILVSAHNERETLRDPTAHAEILALRRASERIGHWRLDGCSLYVTLEPCAMCAGAIINARVDGICFGAYDARFGCCETLYPLLGEQKFNHHPWYKGGVLEEECKALLQAFFRARR